MYFSVVMIQKDQFKTVVVLVKRVDIQDFLKLVHTKDHRVSVNKEIFGRGYKVHVVFNQCLNGFYGCFIVFQEG